MTMAQIGMISMPQVRVGIVGHAMQLVGNHMHFLQFKNNCTHNSQLYLMQFLTVTGNYYS